MTQQITKLSEAIRIGAQKRPQCFDGVFRMDFQSNQYRSCALGAALEAMFPSNNDQCVSKADMKDLREALHLSENEVIKDPFYGTEYDICLVIMSLNDDQRWSREKIADWLESIGY